MSMSSSSRQQLTSRLLALDVFRGLTIIAMIVVNSPGTYGELSHAHWEGILFADLVFPFFILIVGVAIPLGFSKQLTDSATQRTLLKKVWHRAVVMFALGLIVNLLYTQFEQIRVLGVLQRIAIVYLACCYLAIYCSIWQTVKIGAGILISYWLLILLVPAPGIEAGSLERGHNLINWFDQFAPGMLWRGAWDPEGVLSTLPAVSTGIIGMLMGHIVMQNRGQLYTTSAKLFILGFGCFATGCIWSLAFPFIKQIWSSSFVLATGGIGAMILGFIVWYTDIMRYRTGTYLPVIFGANAITAYVLHVVIEKLLDWPLSGTSLHALYQQLAHSAGLSGLVSATLWVLLFLSICTLPVWWLYRRHIFIKI
ncbi:acyltransferase family protein [Salinimonas lutimaris]|uniref:acyltransferase family protein n=1 Tax=Salinimonas lutimaris TaxID=914153 RepID=UPI0010C1187E|nr:heparan-alpha-glucosaminide N-acetyltransferase domain-containing protein [Salinimonas lutimaris]